MVHTLRLLALHVRHGDVLQYFSEIHGAAAYGACIYMSKIVPLIDHGAPVAPRVSPDSYVAFAMLHT